MKRIHIGMEVSDLDASIRFYSTLFGAEPISFSTLFKSDLISFISSSSSGVTVT